MWYNPAGGGRVQVEAQVMLLKNLELGSGQRMLVNGSRGVVTGFIDKQVLAWPVLSWQVSVFDT